MMQTNSRNTLIGALALLIVAVALALASVVFYGGWDRISRDLPAFLTWLLLGAAAFYTGLVVVTIAVRALSKLGSPK